MLNREERGTLAERLRHFAAGLITNEELCDSLPRNTGDYTLEYICTVVETSFEGLFCKPYRLSASTQEDRQELCQIIMYLYTEREIGDFARLQLKDTVGVILALLLSPFVLALTPFILAWDRFVLPLIQSKFASKRNKTRDFWPFADQADYEEALKHPKLLCGKRAA